ncbi:MULTISPECIES: hypothetical protein [Caballeronia]|jgi:hypothetical protein|uniref:Uncharacterized protein n=1 Tax=Caballeronia zhejiangensis TaxID=871203 RepID=A0A656QS53_9BURK|nr:MULTISPECIES: hypothetical protein [Caballeronia]EKS70582.1 hypothetical protein BURK_011718 [Burkholderia sp. SJ98]KDR33640.1 hypothetical protein BG60_00225 [Caballeronia zhejiangensis]MCG7405129.1 hypothetical protein [Caballeronia zhejiangensis]MCI1047290.1 hypothetical protein [Caballeronia zhejiangensis]MDR5766543.1 hypothetical protein [Caballeronia sp. LZ028]
MDLEAESLALVQADRDINEGKERIERQRKIIEQLRSGGHDTTDAVRLLSTLEDTLTAMMQHRSLIVARIAQWKSGILT